MVSVANEAAKILDKIKISTEVINMHTIKPIDKDQIKKSSKNSKLLVSLEEHSIIGGLGSSITEAMDELSLRPKLLKLGLEDKYNFSGEYNYVLEKNNLTSDGVSKSIKKEFKKL